MHIIDYIQNKNISEALISPDTEKAFDRVNWIFLYQVLEKFGLDGRAVNCIKTMKIKIQLQGKE